MFVGLEQSLHLGGAAIESMLDNLTRIQMRSNNLMQAVGNISNEVNQLAEVQPNQKKPLSNKALRKQSLVTCKGRGEEQTCSVCLGPVQKGARTYKLVCGHTFHVKCI